MIAITDMQGGKSITEICLHLKYICLFNNALESIIR